MKETTPKEKVLKSIRDALVNQMDAPFEGVEFDRPVFSSFSYDFLEETFARAFLEAGGQFVFCQNVEELASALMSLVKQKKLESLYCGEDFLHGLLGELKLPFEKEAGRANLCDASLTGCEALVARHGSIWCSSRQGGGRRAYIYPPVHIVVATTAQMHSGLEESIGFLKEKYGNAMPSLLTCITGPSRTADIEKTLVMGAHGPKELYLLLLDTSNGENHE